MIAGYAEEVHEHLDGFVPVAQQFGPAPAGQRLVVYPIPFSYIPLHAVARSDLAARCHNPAALSLIDW